MLLALGISLGVGGVIGAQVAGLAGDIPRYTSTIQQKVQAVHGVTIGRLTALADRMATQIDRGNRAPAPSGVAEGSRAGGATPVEAPANPVAKPMPVEVHQPDPSPTELAQRLLTPILAPLATTGIVVVVAIFILLRRRICRNG